MKEARALLEKSRDHEMAVLEISTAQYAPVLSTESVHLTGSDVAQTIINYAAEPSLGTGGDMDQQERDEEVSPATESFRRGSQGSRKNSTKDHGKLKLTSLFKKKSRLSKPRMNPYLTPSSELNFIMGSKLK